MPTLHRTVVRPVITEKTSEAYQSKGEYTFEVAPDASKPQIRQAIERLFMSAVPVGPPPTISVPPKVASKRTVTTRAPKKLKTTSKRR